MSNKKNWRKAAEMRDGSTFVAWPHICAEHWNFYRLSITAKALLFCLLSQFKGNNNGDFCCAWGIMKPKGWKSRTTIDKARDELLQTGWIVCTRQGGRNKPNLYAVTFIAIDECKGKLDSRSFTNKPLGYWKTGINPELLKSQKAA